MSDTKKAAAQLDETRQQLEEKIGELELRERQLEEENARVTSLYDQVRQQQSDLELAESEAIASQDRLYQSLRKDKLVLQTQTQQAELKIGELTRANIEAKDKIEALERTISQMKSDENTAAKKLQRQERLTEQQQATQEQLQHQVTSTLSSDLESPLVEGLKTEIENLKAELVVLKRENRTANFIKSNGGPFFLSFFLPV